MSELSQRGTEKGRLMGNRRELDFLVDKKKKKKKTLQTADLACMVRTLGSANFWMNRETVWM